MSRWSYLALGLGHFGDVPGQVPMLLEDGSTADDNFPAFMERLDRTLERISDRHNVIIIQTVPKYDTSIPKAMLRNVRFGAQLPVQTRAEYDLRESRTNEAVEALGLEYGATIISPQDVLCETGTCIIQKDGLPLYFDQVHLSPSGNDLLLEILLDEMGRQPDVE